MEYTPINLKEKLAKSISHTAEFEINQPVQVVFPLFTPEGEKRWAPGWDYENIMGTRTLDEDYIFLTRTHDHAANEAIWIVKSYEPETHRVRYYKIEPGEKVGIIEAACDPLTSGSTKVQVTYRYVGLSEAGNRFVERFTKKDYEAFIEGWKRLIESYFAKDIHSSVQPGR
jgi:hypothetical protein